VVDQLEPMPHDSDAERMVLGACLYGAKRLEIVREVLEAGDFYHDRHQRIYSAMVELARRGHEVDPATVASSLRDLGQLDDCGGFDYLAQLTSIVPLSNNARTYAAAVKDKATRRALIASAMAMATAAREAETASEAQAQAYDLVSSAISAHAAVAEVQITGGDLLAVWSERTKLSGTPIPTGIPALDSALRGGWRRQQVHVLTARTGIGKSGMACAWASAAISAGFKVGIASLEMPEEEVMARIIAQRTGIPYHECENGPDNIPSSTDREFAQLEARKIGPYLVVDEANAYSVAEMRRRMLALRRHHGCDLVILDQFNNISGTGKSDYERKQSVNDELQRLGHPKGLGVPLIVLAQQNRAGVAGAGLDTIKGCGDVEEGAPVVIALECQAGDFGDADETPYTLRVLKNRGGRKVKIELFGDNDTYAWRQVDRSDAAPQQTARASRRGVDGERADSNERDPFGDWGGVDHAAQ